MAALAPVDLRMVSQFLQNRRVWLVPPLEVPKTEVAFGVLLVAGPLSGFLFFERNRQEVDSSLPRLVRRTPHGFRGDRPASWGRSNSLVYST